MNPPPDSPCDDHQDSALEPSVNAQEGARLSAEAWVVQSILEGHNSSAIIQGLEKHFPDSDLSPKDQIKQGIESIQEYARKGLEFYDSLALARLDRLFALCMENSDYANAMRTVELTSKIAHRNHKTLRESLEKLGDK